MPVFSLLISFSSKPDSSIASFNAIKLYAAPPDLSMDMAELSLLPAIRELPMDYSVVASGTSCRQQIGHGSSRVAHHFVHLMQQSLSG